MQELYAMLSLCTHCWFLSLSYYTNGLLGQAAGCSIEGLFFIGGLRGFPNFHTLSFIVICADFVLLCDMFSMLLDLIASWATTSPKPLSVFKGTLEQISCLQCDALAKTLFNPPSALRSGIDLKGWRGSR